MKYRLTAVLCLIAMFILGYYKNYISKTFSEDVYLYSFMTVTIICIICWGCGFAEHDREMTRKGLDPFAFKEKGKN